MDTVATPIGAEQEIIAADGGRRHPAAHSLADLMRMLEDGQFDADVSYDLKELAGDIENIAQAQGNNGKIKAKLAITLEIVREPDGIYMLTAAHKITRPIEKRKRSVAWLTENNSFTPNMPNQGQMFGTIRDVTPRRAVRN